MIQDRTHDLVYKASSFTTTPQKFRMYMYIKIIFKHSLKLLGQSKLLLCLYQDQMSGGLLSFFRTIGHSEMWFAVHTVGIFVPAGIIQ